MSLIESFLLGLLQGITEFLPVSSSGHLALGKHLLGLDPAIVDSPTFEIIVHIATSLSIVVVLQKDLRQLLKGAAQLRWNNETRYLGKIVVAMIPIAIVGVFFKDQAEALFTAGLLLVGIMLLVTSLLLLLTHFYKAKNPHPIRFVDAAVIGLLQAVAILPGLSRSGTTIATSLLLGNPKSEAAKFSFLIVLVPILGEAFLGIVKGEFAPSVTGIGVAPLLVGFCTAFVVGCAACKFMIALVQRTSLIWFAVYCAIVGTLSLVL
ncbi:undecaprenyl-diphosphatase [Bacteroidia bacterium]|nr:undecaprenyl-diphosphatase [Bacteroidia bacterium]